MLHVRKNIESVRSSARPIVIRLRRSILSKWMRIVWKSIKNASTMTTARDNDSSDFEVEPIPQLTTQHANVNLVNCRPRLRRNTVCVKIYAQILNRRTAFTYYHRRRIWQAIYEQSLQLLMFSLRFVVVQERYAAGPDECVFISVRRVPRSVHLRWQQRCARRRWRNADMRKLLQGASKRRNSAVLENERFRVSVALAFARSSHLAFYFAAYTLHVDPSTTVREELEGDHRTNYWYIFRVRMFRWKGRVSQWWRRAQ